MSFIGSIRPFVKGDSTVQPRRGPALLLALGFAISALAIYGTAHAVGGLTLGWLRGTGLAFALASAILAALLAMDLGLLGLRVPMLRRQTPQRYMYKFNPELTAFLWGLDTGLAVTTIRVSSLTWAGMALAVVGLVPWWAGAAYALGFVVPLLVSVLLIPVRTDATGATTLEPIWLMELLHGAIAWVRRGARALLAAAALATAVMSLATVWSP